MSRKRLLAFILSVALVLAEFYQPMALYANDDVDTIDTGSPNEDIDHAEAHEYNWELDSVSWDKANDVPAYADFVFVCKNQVDELIKAGNAIEDTKSIEAFKWLGDVYYYCNTVKPQSVYKDLSSEINSAMSYDDMNTFNRKAKIIGYLTTAKYDAASYNLAIIENTTKALLDAYYATGEDIKSNTSGSEAFAWIISLKSYISNSSSYISGKVLSEINSAMSYDDIDTFNRVNKILGYMTSWSNMPAVDNATGSDDSITVRSDAIEVIEEDEASITYQATVTFEGKEYKDTYKIAKKDLDWRIESVSWNGSFDVKPTKVEFTLVSDKDGTHYVVTAAEADITLLSADIYSKKYKAVITVNDIQFEDIMIFNSDLKGEFIFTSLPIAKVGLVYNGNAQELITGVTELSSGIIKYSLSENGPFTEDIPTGINAGEYTVFYKGFGNESHKDSDVRNIVASIAKATPSLNNAPQSGSTIKHEFIGEEIQLIDPAIETVSGCTVLYRLDDGEWTVSAPMAKCAGDYIVAYKVQGNENYLDIAEKMVRVTIKLGDNDKILKRTDLGIEMVLKPSTPVQYDGKKHVWSGTVLTEKQKKTMTADLDLRIIGVPEYLKTTIHYKNSVKADSNGYYYVQLSLDKNKATAANLSKTQKKELQSVAKKANKDLKKKDFRVGLSIIPRDLEAYSYDPSASLGNKVVFTDEDKNIIVVDYKTTSKGPKIKSVKCIFGLKTCKESTKQIARVMRNSDGKWSVVLTGAKNYKGVLEGTVGGKGTDIYAIMKVKGYGTVKIKLRRDVAPITVDNFVELAESGFYDGLTFHRIMRGFMMQGGDPTGTGNGDPNQRTIKGEFSANGVKNDLSHKRGVISMARGTDPDSANSQFFIMQEDYASLDGLYAAFGKVVSGMDVVDEICNSARPIDDNGFINMEDRPVIESMTIVDSL